ncbi:MAG: hypothetical protein COS17_08145 [Elusimicrobia bacterium CG02_land_8_20_14_3_00_37_13]|nr:MAG: hypothetical protein COS17_08145 [Elusimicrobia bacterium CG02_land_8_20_14_3_00_37_13]
MMKGWAGNREHRYYFFLNKYDDIAFTRCPKCNRETRKRMFCLFIHIEPKQLISFNKSCRFCPDCGLIIVKKKELENYLVAMCEKHNPDIIGNDYVVLGTIDRDLHQKGKQGKLNINTAIDCFIPFIDHLTFEVHGGWQPKGK